MTDQEVQLLLADLALIIILARLLGALAKRIGQPPVIGEIVAGLLLGPTLFDGKITSTLFPSTLIPPLTTIADIGLVLFMFVVGYEVDLSLVKGREKVAAGVAIGSIFLPLVLGAGLGVWLAQHDHVHNKPVFVLFFGVAMSITAFPVLARILTDRGIHRTRIGGLALAAASVDDVLAWTLLAVVVAVAGASGNEIRLVLAPVYAAAIIFVVRPGLRKLADVYQQQGRLTPSVLATIIIVLLLSAYATDWMGVKFIFGAFILGIVMPRNAPALRLSILERLEHISVIVFLPVFFVIAGLSVNLSGIGLSGLADLGLIMAVAVIGKFGGAYFGARFTGVRRRQAGVLAALMNTRGLTELVILTVGLNLGILTQSLYSLMVVMAIVTTAMAGPLLKYIYPNRIMERDITEADRSALGRAGAHRVVVLVDDPVTAVPLVDVATRLALTKANTDIVLAHLVKQTQTQRLEVGLGLGTELLQMTQTMDKLNQLAAAAEQRGITTLVQARFSEDVKAELAGYVTAADPDTVVMNKDAMPFSELRNGGKAQLVIVLRPLPDSPSAVAAVLSRGDDSDAAVQVAAHLAAAGGLDLVIGPAGRASTSRVSDLARRGVQALASDHPVGSLLVAPADLVLAAPAGAAPAAAARAAAAQAAAAQAAAAATTIAGGNGAGPETAVANGTPSTPASSNSSSSTLDAHLAVVAGSNEASDDMDQWVEALNRPEQSESRQQ